MNYTTFAETLIKGLGGKENIVSVTHCATRLRVTIKDDSIVNKEHLGNTDGVMGVVKLGTQYQIILGPHLIQT